MLSLTAQSERKMQAMVSWVSAPVCSLSLPRNNDTRVWLLGGGLYQRHRYDSVKSVSVMDMADVCPLKGLVKKVSKALKETGGATAEYQLVVIELKSLKSILRHLETLQPTKDNVIHVNAIRGMALACQLPLRDFMVKLEEYESTMGPFADKRSLRAMAKKSKWAVLFAKEVERLRAMVAAKNISLNLLLAMNTS